MIMKATEILFRTRSRVATAASIGLMACALAAGCQSSSTRQTAWHDAGDVSAANYLTNILHEGDRISITFQYATNFNTIDRIGLDGALNLDAVGKVVAAGKTAQALETELATRYEPQAGKDLISVRVV